MHAAGEVSRTDKNVRGEEKIGRVFQNRTSAYTHDVLEEESLVVGSPMQSISPLRKMTFKLRGFAQPLSRRVDQGPFFGESDSPLVPEENHKNDDANYRRLKVKFYKSLNIADSKTESKCIARSAPIPITFSGAKSEFDIMEETSNVASFLRSFNANSSAQSESLASELEKHSNGSTLDQ